MDREETLVDAAGVRVGERKGRGRGGKGDVASRENPALDSITIELERGEGGG